mmetsp:Transcript_36802/g.57372  ORF Transcript_36802/g.57372 Transcript_36802/m.57372 type:complete len:172 (-) Transcript_36802:383-898(-)
MIIIQTIDYHRIFVVMFRFGESDRPAPFRPPLNVGVVVVEDPRRDPGAFVVYKVEIFFPNFHQLMPIKTSRTASNAHKACMMRTSGEVAFSAMTGDGPIGLMTVAEGGTVSLAGFNEELACFFPGSDSTGLITSSCSVSLCWVASKALVEKISICAAGLVTDGSLSVGGLT